MVKPTPVTKTYLDYSECAKYVAQELGIKDIRDCAGKWSLKNSRLKNDDIPYQDFWHFIWDTQAPGNPSVIYINSDLGATEEWQQKIIDKFVEEFGDDADYWVEW